MLSETFENVQNGEIKSESGFRVAMASQPLEEILMLGWLSRLSFWWLCWEASTSPVSSASCPTNAGKPTMSSLVSSMPTLMHTSCRTPSRTASSWPTSRSTLGVHLQCSGQTSGCLDVIFTFHSSCGEGWKVGILCLIFIGPESDHWLCLSVTN